ncbi:unnamed protein product [Clonostachys solani]|uniref:Amidohydrolase-related domain-containing protein n=1 Tax=Clonostachys solani TaxID=160281 RepID=A0A9N9ZB33_9HYPO|nr:unnamed protein product [Clonostachys solani]
MVNIAQFLAFAAFAWQGSCASSSSKLLFGETIVAWDDKTELPNVIQNGLILVVDDRIQAVSSQAQPSHLPKDVEMINVSGQIITPGFEHNASRVLPRHGEFAAAAHFRPKDVYLGQLAGLYEALNAGVTTTLDHAHHTWSNDTIYTGLNASIVSGGRVFWAYAFHDIPALNYTIVDQIPNFQEIAESSILDGTNTELAIAYDSWGPEPGAEAKQIAGMVKEFNVSVLTTHYLAEPWGFGNLPEDVYPFDVLNGSVPVVFSHGSFITARGARLLRYTHPHSYVFQDQAALGVDTHFTLSTDILTQARIWLQSAWYHFSDEVMSEWRIPRNNPMSVVQAFTLATRSGGLALRRPDLGVIQVGAKADIVVWNAQESPALLGWTDPITSVILHATVGDVLHVAVNGSFVKRDGKLTAKK